jgi:hypothetical protein
MTSIPSVEARRTYVTGPNPGVHADDERNTFGAGTFDYLGAHSIAFFETVRDVKYRRTARELDSCLQNDYRCRPVDIVVAVDQDLFARRGGFLEPRDGSGHAQHGKRIVQVLEIRV